MLFTSQFAGIMLLATTSFAQVPGITYYLSTCGGQNCVSVCKTFGLLCAQTGQSFPPTSALSIFESLGISCVTDKATDNYVYKDNPSYVVEYTWAGRCIGFKSIPATIDCSTANNTSVRRLCPCVNPLNKTFRTTNAPSPTRNPDISLQTQTTNRKDTSYQKNSSGTPQQRIINGKARLQMMERTTFVIAAVLGVALALCLSALVFVVLRNRKRLRNKNDSGTISDKRFECRTPKNDLEMQEVIDRSMVETNAEEEPRPYEHAHESVSDNILYASFPEEANQTRLEDSVPLYDRLV